MDQAGSTGTMPTNDDRAALRRAQAGDLAAFELVVAERLDGLWRLARALLGSDEAAADAVVSTLLGCWRELPRLDDLERFDAWLERILLSECRVRLATSGPGGPPPPPPPGLLGEAMADIQRAPPRPPAARRDRPRPELASWLALALGLVALAAVTALGIDILRQRSDSGAGAATSGTPAPSGAIESPSAASPAQATASPDPLLGVMHPGGLAMVTLEGDNLRVRPAPGTGDDARPLRTRLPAGTRMLVVDGPVEADGYTWWEIQTDSEVVDMFGWVAAGEHDVDWIAPTEAKCVGSPDAAAVTSMSRIDFLACNGSTEVSFQADAAALWDVEEVPGDCGWVRERDGCDVDNAWLLLPSTVVQVATGPDTRRELQVAMPPDLAAQLALLPPHRTLRLTVAMDSPDAQGCGIRDARTGDLLLSHDQAVTACRLEFVVQEVAFRQ